MKIVRSTKHLPFNKIKPGNPFTTLHEHGLIFIKLDKEYGISSPADYVNKVNTVDISTGKLYRFDELDEVYPINGSFIEDYNPVVI